MGEQCFQLWVLTVREYFSKILKSENCPPTANRPLRCFLWRRVDSEVAIEAKRVLNLENLGREREVAGD